MGMDNQMDIENSVNFLLNFVIARHLWWINKATVYTHTYNSHQTSYYYREPQLPRVSSVTENKWTAAKISAFKVRRQLEDDVKSERRAGKLERGKDVSIRHDI